MEFDSEIIPVELEDHYRQAINDDTVCTKKLVLKDGIYYEEDIPIYDQDRFDKNGLRIIPIMPSDQLAEAEIGDNGMAAFKERWVRKGEKGEEVENPDQVFWRVGYNNAHVKKPHLFHGLTPEMWEDIDVEGCFMSDPLNFEYDCYKTVMKVAIEFTNALKNMEFLPNSPAWTGSGTILDQRAACFVLKIIDDLGKDKQGIYSTANAAVQIQQRGGGVGFAFSNLREEGAFVKSSGGRSTGPINFLLSYDHIFRIIAQGGVRRGANMAGMRDSHPDIYKFVVMKRQEGTLSCFNISVCASDLFVKRAKEGAMHELISPRTGKVVKEVPARELWNLIVDNANHNGEPGILFIDTANKTNPVPHLYEYEITNPCGEQWLGPYENCCLGSVNLAKHFGKVKGTVDWDKFAQTIRTGIDFLNNIVFGNGYVPSVPEVKAAALRCRRIGLGYMGLADLMYYCGIRYGSEEAEEFASQVTEFMKFHSMKRSIELSQIQGPFPAFPGSIYDPNGCDNLKYIGQEKAGRMAWEPPTPLSPYKRDYGRPFLNWNEIIEGIKEHGIAHAAFNTIAPTGTLATVAGCEAYGCECVFALAYTRIMQTKEGPKELKYISKLFRNALEEEGLSKAEIEKIQIEVAKTGSCQNVPGVPENIRKVFVVTQDLTGREHVRMQACIQRFIDNSISKTCNLPKGTTQEQISEIYFMAHELGCKGITVYVDGSRQQVVLKTNSSDEKKPKETKNEPKNKNVKRIASDQQKYASILNGSVDNMNMAYAIPALCEEFELPNQRRLPKPVMDSYTARVSTPVGKTIVTVTFDDHGPFEVFIIVGKAGTQTCCEAEGFGRIISEYLREVSPVRPLDRFIKMIKQNEGIGGIRSTGKGTNKILSLPDGFANAGKVIVAKYLRDKTERAAFEEWKRTGATRVYNSDDDDENFSSSGSEEDVLPTVDEKQGPGDNCPSCHEPGLDYVEGCNYCRLCGYGECNSSN